MSTKDLAERIAFGFLGRPYYWGGDDPMQGFDCSGFVIEILKSVGLLQRNGDWTAAGLSSMFPHVDVPYRGCLVFWENAAGKIIHVEYCLDETFSIGASGGGSSTTSEQAAITGNAYIKVRPFRSRNRIAGFADPWKP